jgi:3',5'-cyclic AMP phosphodiesterase CpdA
VFLLLIITFGGCTYPSDNFTGNVTGAITFAIYGDSRDNFEIHRQIVMKMQEYHPLFVIHTGDFVNSGDSIYEWRKFEEITQALKIYPTVGNHDYPLENYFKIFGVPSYYSLDYECIHMVSINAFENLSPGSPQYRWLEEDLNTTPQWKWKIVFLHLPPYSSGKHGSNIWVRENLVPLLEKYAVDFVFSGHDHGYERSYPILGGEVNESGVVYFVSGGGGADLYGFGSNWWTAKSKSTHHFILGEVNLTIARFIAIDAQGNVFDIYTKERAKPRVLYTIPYCND